MVFIVGASCISHLKEGCGQKMRKVLESRSYSKPGLSVNPQSRNPTKTVQYYFNNKFVLKNRKNLIIWHDVINNSITNHRSNYCSITNTYRPLSPDDLIATLKKLNIRNQITAIVYTRRAGTPDLSRKLHETGILVLDCLKHLIPRNKKNDLNLLAESTKVHPDSHLEGRFVTRVLLNGGNLRRLILKKRPDKPKKKPNKKQKDRIKKRKLQQQQSS